MTMPENLTRREFGQGCAVGAASLAVAHCATASADEQLAGAIRGEPIAEKVGLQVLQSGGNAVDACVAAALVAAVVVPYQTGIGGYGGHATLYHAATKRITSIDFNTAAPAAARGDMFPQDAQGRVVGQANMFGWRAAGVPGILAGLELALKTYGTRSFREMVQPAIGYAKGGFPTGPAAASIRGAVKHLAADPASARLYLRDGKPLTAADHFANPDLAALLETLAADNSVESFYRGPIAERIAAAFRANGGLVTAADLAAYQAREVTPLQLAWNDWTIHTAPLTAGGATVLHALALLQEMKWAERDAASPDALQMQVEALRYAWQDRLEFLGDPQEGPDGSAKLLEPSQVRKSAQHIEQAVAEGRPLPPRTTTRPDQGTINLSALDRQGNLIALTLTHGGSFGARVTVPGLGLTLGHGMSRFDPHPGHPNAPGPGKRPLNNMCPTIVAQNGQPRIALGARGGRKIPNAIAEALLQLVARSQGLEAAVAAPRLHTEGSLAVAFEKHWPAAPIAELKTRGYQVATAASATISAVGFSAQPGSFVSAMR